MTLLEQYDAEQDEIFSVDENDEQFMAWLIQEGEYYV
jgi:hypothetical protein